MILKSRDVKQAANFPLFVRVGKQSTWIKLVYILWRDQLDRRVNRGWDVLFVQQVKRNLNEIVAVSFREGSDGADHPRPR